MNEKPSPRGLIKVAQPPTDGASGEQGPDPLSTRHILDRASQDKDLGTRPVGGRGTPRLDGRLTEGTLLQSRYRIIGTVGSGGMSTVYKAQDMRFPNVQRFCAVKEMRNTAADPQVRAMVLRNFEREASILATLSHPAIVQVYDYFSEEELSYLVLEFVPGKDLETLLNETEGFLSEALVVNWAAQICDVLSYLHNHKPTPIIFRDMKPSNVMLDGQSRIRLVDFGIAKVFQSGEKGTMIGTEGYSPPEQYRGSAEPRGDIYALGATMHHLLSKQDPRLEPPFSFHERPIHKTNPVVSNELQDIITRVLEYDINHRFASAEEMKRALLSLRSVRSRGGTTTAMVGLETAGPDMPTAIWQFACEDEIRSSPAIGEGKIYIGAYDRNLYALDIETGKFLWKYPTEGGIASSPCVAEGKVFFGSEDQSLYALNADTGRLVWTCPTKGRIYSSPRVQFGHVFVGSDDRQLYAINVVSGRVAWTYPAEGAIRSTPGVGNDAIYFGDEGGAVYAVGVSSKQLWRFSARRGITSSPLLMKDVLLIGSQDTYIYALDLRSGWAVWRYRTGGPVVSSPAALGDMVFVGSSDNEVYAFDSSNGHLVWRYKTEGQVNSSPTAHNDAVYVGSLDGYLYVLDARSGQLRWRFQTSGAIISSPRIADDTVYVGSTDHNLYALPT